LSIGETISRRAEGKIFSVGNVPSRRVAVVFGSKVFPDGKLSSSLYLRLKTALELYQSGKVEKILVSGDNRKSHYNEPEKMRDWLLKCGVREEDVSCDYAGFRTLDTCARAAKVWNLKQVTLVTQRFHLPRALYLADAWGLEAIGVSADGTGFSTRRRDLLRETAARTLAWLDINLLDRQPHFLGQPETL